jgi:hypothetical protein
VASYGDDQLRLRLDVIGDLWKAGIASDLQYDDHRVMEEITADCLGQNILSVFWALTADIACWSSS